jgi:hypothetical protein
MMNASNSFFIRCVSILVTKYAAASVVSAPAAIAGQARDFSIRLFFR